MNHVHTGERRVTRPDEVADGVWAHARGDGSWWINTTGFADGTKIVAIDASATEARTRVFGDVVDATTGRRPSILVNTPPTANTFGNCPGAATPTRRCGRARRVPRRGGLGLHDWAVHQRRRRDGP